MGIVTDRALTIASGLLSLYNRVIMSYKYTALNDKPLALWMLDDSTPFQDYSPYARSGLMHSGTPTSGPAVVSGASFAQVFNNSNVAKFSTPIYVPGYELQSWSMEMSVRVINQAASGAQKLLSNSAVYDGLTINGTVISFTTNYVTEPDAVVSYDLQVAKNAHIVAVHSVDRNQLYVNGALVGEVLFTAAQMADTFTSNDGFLYCGTSASAQKVAVNGVALYSYDLNAEQVENHFSAARRAVLSNGYCTPFGGMWYPTSQLLSDVYLNTTWTTESDWKLGILTDVTIVNNRLVPTLVGGVSEPGTWQTVVPLDAGVSSIYGISFSWDGQGAVVDISLNGSTWETIVQGVRPALIPAAYDPTAKDLYLRVTFAGGVTDDPAYIDNLTVVGFKTGTMVERDGRLMSITSPASPMYAGEVLEYRDDWGVRLTSGGILTIGADTTSVADDMFTFNIWMKKLTTTTPTFAATLTGTTYVNGVAGSTLTQGEWAMYTIAKATAFSGALTVTGDVQIGQIELYDHQLSAQEVADLYASAVGVKSLSSPDTSVITISEPATATKLYDYVWSIIGGGGA